MGRYVENNSKSTLTPIHLRGEYGISILLGHPSSDPWTRADVVSARVDDATYCSLMRRSAQTGDAARASKVSELVSKVS